MSSKRDYYEVLGVEKTATDDEIKKAYRKKAKEFHPDANPNDKVIAEAKFKEANEAYETLSDKQKRGMYDQFGHDAANGYNGGAGFGGFNGTGFNGMDMDFDMGDIFSSFFGGGFANEGSRRRGPARGRDIKVAIEITFEEAVFGTKKEITISREETCSTCNGTGAKAGTQPKTCPTCGGTGQVRYTQNTILGQIMSTRTCTKCGGEGKIIDTPCQDCKGKSTVKKQRKITISIPQGIDNNQTISIRGEGNSAAKGGIKGDLYITVFVKPHATFKRKGDDIYADIKVPFTIMALGGEIDITTLTGRIKQKISEGTPTGTVVCIKNQGVKNINGYRQGDMYITLVVDVPTNLNAQQKELLQQLNDTFGIKNNKKKGLFN